MVSLSLLKVVEVFTSIQDKFAFVKYLLIILTLLLDEYSLQSLAATIE
jgi:hypothetical protein